MRWFSKSGIVQVCSVPISCPAPSPPPSRRSAPLRGEDKTCEEVFRGYSGAGLSTTGGFSLQFLSCVICYLWAAVSTPPYERLPPFSTPDDPRAGGSVKTGPVPIYPTRVWAPAFSRRSNFGAQSQVGRPCTQEKPPAQNAVREQRTRNRSTRPYFDTLVTFLWYDLLISGGLRSVGWGTSLPRVTTLSFPPLFLVCNTLLLNGGARNTRSRPWRGAMFAPRSLGGLPQG